jgi:hypothetical protein
MHKTQKPKRARSAYAQLKSSYGLKTPQQIKMRILWIHIQALVRSTFDQSPENKVLLEKYTYQWKVCEQEEK